MFDECVFINKRRKYLRGLFSYLTFPIDVIIEKHIRIHKFPINLREILSFKNISAVIRPLNFFIVTISNLPTHAKKK